MRKIAFLLVLAISFWSCSLDDSANSIGDFYFDYIPFESVDMPQEFQFGESYVVEYTYYRPSTCHYFNDLYNEIDSNMRTIVIINTAEVDYGQCIELQEELVTRSFVFLVQQTGTYLFRFWQGEDSNGDDVYLEIEVPVIE